MEEARLAKTKRVFDPDKDVIEFGLIHPETGQVVKIEVELGTEAEWASRPESLDPRWQAASLTGRRVLAARLSL